MRSQKILSIYRKIRPRRLGTLYFRRPGGPLHSINAPEIDIEIEGPLQSVAFNPREFGIEEFASLLGMMGTHIDFDPPLTHRITDEGEEPTGYPGAAKGKHEVAVELYRGAL